MPKPQSRQATSKTPSKPALPASPQLAKPAEAPARRPMTDAEAALVEAYVVGTGPEIKRAQGAVLLERMDSGLAEEFVRARVIEVEAMAARQLAWDRLAAALNFTGGTAIGPVYEKLHDEAKARIEARRSGVAPADSHVCVMTDGIRPCLICGKSALEVMSSAPKTGTPAHAAEFRETQRAAAASPPCAKSMTDLRAEERHRQGSSLFTAAEVDAQDALERSKQITLSPPPNTAESGANRAPACPRY